MADLIVPLGVRELEEVLAALEREFSAQGVPTLLRLRAAMVTEELFRAHCADGVTAAVRTGGCTLAVRA